VQKTRALRPKTERLVLKSSSVWDLVPPSGEVADCSHLNKAGRRATVVCPQGRVSLFIETTWQTLYEGLVPSDSYSYELYIQHRS